MCGKRSECFCMVFLCHDLKPVWHQDWKPEVGSLSVGKTIFCYLKKKRNKAIVTHGQRGVFVCSLFVALCGIGCLLERMDKHEGCSVFWIREPSGNEKVIDADHLEMSVPQMCIA